jgi:hypothetical protein
MFVQAAGRVAVIGTPPALWVVIATGLFAVLVSASSFLYMIDRKYRILFNINVLGTIVHEAGHAIANLVTGGGVYRIEIDGPDAGLLRGWHESRLSSIISSIAGYAMPSLAGLGAAALLHRGRASAVLTLTVVIMALLLVVSRDLLTFGSIAAVGVVAFATLRWGPTWLQTGVVCTETWLLLTSEVGGLVAIVANRIQGATPLRDDAQGLADETHLPGVIWILGWFFVIGWALWNGVPLL